MVPHPLDEIVVADARQRALGAERHRDLLVKTRALKKFPAFVGAGTPEIESESPLPVQIEPSRTLELRPGMFRSRYHKIP